MANKRIFNTGTPVAPSDTVNKAGGRAYKRGNQEALAQYVCTGTLNDTFYASAKEQLDRVLELTQNVPADFMAKLAIYGRNSAFMKDTPALLLAVLSKRDPELFEKTFPRVIDNGRMLRTFVQIVRSGVVGRRSLGSLPKRMVRRALESMSDEQLFNSSVGNDPSIADVIKMVHPKPSNLNREAFYGYLIDRQVDRAMLPKIVQDYLDFKEGKATEPPSVEFRLLTSLPLTKDHWTKIAENAPWHMTRMNLNTFARHGVFGDGRRKIVRTVADRLRDPNAIKRSKVFPYQLFAAYVNTGNDVPTSIRNALQDAMEIAIENVPSLDGKVVVGVDCSGSMTCSITGYRPGATSAITCNQVASLIASAILRKNEETRVFQFDTVAKELRLNPRDTVMTNAEKIGRNGGGTDCSCVLAKLNAEQAKADLVVIVSDNESWADRANWWGSRSSGSGTTKEWKKFKRRNPNARLVLIDLVASDNTQAPTRPDTLNVGGFSDSVFTILSLFSKEGLNGDAWTKVINTAEL